jgi:hypothetical protein
MPGAPLPAGGRGGAGRAVLWAVVGAVVASALWGGGVLLLGGSSGSSADLRGYKTTDDLCARTDTSPFKETYPKSDEEPTTYFTKGKAVDTMSCNQTLEMSDSDFADAYLYVQYALHKKTDPAPEFADNWLGYTQEKDAKYEVKPISGFGDEAYLVTEDTLSDDSGDRYVTLAVRDGWVTYSMNWSQYESSLDSDSDSTDSVPTIDEATQWVKTATKATLAKLK